MKIQFRPLFLGIFAALFTSCNDNDNLQNDDTLNVSCPSDCFTINMGNFSESNGSVCLLKEGKSIEQNIFSKANGYNLRSIIESASFYGNTALLMCGNEDKVAYIDRKTGKETATATTGIGLPRYAAINGIYAYVTCVNPSWTDTMGHITKINLTNFKVEKRVPIKGNPEHIVLHNKQLFISSGNAIYTYSLTKDTITSHIPHNQSNATLRYFATDMNNKLWCSYAHYDKWGNGSDCGLVCLNENDSAIDTTITLPFMNADGYIDVNKDKSKLYYLYSSDVVGGQNPEAQTAIYTFDFTSKTASSTPLCKGYGFYGFNVDPHTGNIYTANVNGFITNSIISIFNDKGDLLQTGLMAGVGTCRFYF